MAVTPNRRGPATEKRGLMAVDRHLTVGIAGDALRQELHRQYLLLAADAPSRLVASGLAYLLCSAFLDWKTVVFLGFMNLSCDIISMRLMRAVQPATQVWLYRLCLGLGFLTEIAFILPPAMIWHVDSAYAKAFAVGMIVTGMMHVTTVRAIHLPVGVLGLLAIVGVSLAFNSFYWVQIKDYVSLGYSTVTVLAAVGYGFGALLQTHALHREAAADRAEADAANAAKSRFLAQVSHELRTPLNAILGLGHAELALNPTPETKARMGILVQSAENLTLILDDILDMSAIQAGAMPIRINRADPVAAISSMVALYRPGFASKGLDLQIYLENDLPRSALFDPQRLRQCLGNLMSNALKYTTAGSVSIKAYCTRPDMLAIEVSDTGPGIAPALREAVFAPFHRGPGFEPGTGLGLAISRALARQMGGDLVLQPTETGAKFLLSLKIEASATLPRDLGAARPEALNLAGRCILVVDDISTNRLVAGTYLRLLGARVVDAASGDEALLVLRNEAVDLVLLDMNMPGLSGVETLRLIHALCGAAAPPVLAMTADAAEAHRRAYLAEGLDGYISKPLSPASLAQALAPHFGTVAAQSTTDSAVGVGAK